MIDSKENQALLLSEEQFRRAIEEAPIPTIMQAEDGQVLKISRSWTELTGYSLSDIPTFDNWITNLVYDGADDLRNRLRKLLAGNDPSINIEFTIRTTLKDIRVWSFSASSPGTLLDGRRFIIGMAVDVTERKKTEETLKESEQLYKTIFDNRDDGFVLVEPIYDENDNACDIRILQLNLAYEQQTGTRAAKVEGKRAKEVAPNLEQEWILVSGEVAKTGRTRRIESYNQRTKKWYDANYIPFSRGRVGILFRDITERKNLEKQLQEKERLAAIGATAGMVGHDIRNPLQAITSDVYLLKDYLLGMPEVPAKSDAAESLEEIDKNVSYIDKIVADLQDYARPLIPHYANVNLYELLVSVFRSIAIPDHVSISIEIDQTLSFKTDSILLQRILTNLITNAIQAMPKGGKLTIGASSDSRHIIVTVVDTGVGIPEHVKPKLFTPMMTTKAKGQGLGLAVVKKSVEAMGGTIMFESQEGKGTKFIIKLPVTDC